MKKIFPLALIFAALAVFSVSCSTKYDASPQVPGKDTTRNPFQGDFTATINGVQFTADTKYFTDQSHDNIRSISISGVQDNYDKDPTTNKTIVITIPDYTGPHAYAVDGGFSGGATATYIVMDSGVVTTYMAKPNDTLSVVNITNGGDKWEGTFNLVVAPNGTGDDDNYTITNGSFSIPK